MSKYIFSLHLFCRFGFIFLSLACLCVSVYSKAMAQVAVKLPDKDVRIYDLQEIDGKIWLGSNKGAFRVEGETAKLLPDKNIFIRQIKVINGTVWLGSNKGAWRVDGNSAKRFPNREIFIEQIQEVGGEVWLRTDQGAWRVDGNVARRLPKDKIQTREIKVVGGKTWLATDKGAYRVDGNSAKKFPKDKVNVKIIEEAAGTVWIGSDTGVWRVDGDTARRITLDKVNIKQIVEINGKTWLATDKGAWRVEGFVARRFPDQDLNIRKIYSLGGKVWLATHKGAWRVDENVSVRIAQSLPQTWWGNVLGKILPENILITPFQIKASYYDSILQKIDPYGEAIPGDFKVIIANDQNSLREKAARGNFESAINFSQSFPAGKQTLFYQARDQWNNAFQGSMSVWVLPNIANTPVIGVGVWLLLVFIIFLLAPVSKTCNYLLMNAWSRRLGSLFIIPLATALLPAARRYLFKRYLRRIRKDEEYSRWKTEFIFPSHGFLPDVFGATLREWRKVFILGKPGVGKTSYFKFLAFHFAHGSISKKLIGEKTIPVFLPLESFIQDSLESMIQDQLSDYAGITDRELVSWLLAKGGFLILIDGLNEIRENRVPIVKNFVSQFGKANFICISSLEQHKEFRDIKGQQLTPLEGDMINDFIRLKVERDCDEDEYKLEQKIKMVLSRFSGNFQKVYTNPQELEFAIELAMRGKAVPESREILYDTLMKDWVGNDLDGFSETLCRQSYEMLSEYRPYFDQIENPLPREIRERLLQKDLLIERRNQFFFRHELIRAGFAAKYFLPRWRKLIGDEKLKITKDWRPMLELTILHLQKSGEASGEIRVLFFQILKKDRELALELFVWLKEINPSVCADWENEFSSKLGADLLASGT